MNHAGNGTGLGRRGCGLVVGCAAVLIVLLGVGVCGGQVWNPSFETTVEGTPRPRPLPLFWWRESPWGWGDHPSFSSKCVRDWCTDGVWAAGLYSKLSNSINTFVFTPGDYHSFCQEMDLTGIGAIVFDVRLAAYSSVPAPFEHFEASLLVGGVPLWSKAVGGVFLDQMVNVSMFTGPKKVELRITALDSGSFTSAYWVQWDNIKTVEGASAIGAVVDLDPDTLNLASQGKWITCYIELEEGFDAALIDGATVTLEEDIQAHMGPEGWATPEASEGNLSDHNENGVLERMVKFERAAVQEIVAAPEATLTVRGVLVDGTAFEGTATIRVVDEGGKKK